MRMWNVDPRIMCREHLAGSHLEIHMFLGSIAIGTSMRGFLDKNLLEPEYLKEYHDMIALEMISRGYKHQSDIPEEFFKTTILKLSDSDRIVKIDKDEALKELLSRCPECTERYNELKVQDGKI